MQRRILLAFILLSLLGALLACGCEEAYYPPADIRPAQSFGYNEPVVATQAAQAKPIRPAPRLVSPEKHALYMRFWPKSTSIAFNELKHKITFYDDEVMPRVRQVFDQGANSGVRRTDDGSVNANNEFPWENTAGLERGANSKTVRFFHLSGPANWTQANHVDGTAAGYLWEFQPGSLFGEILTVTDPNGIDHTFEVRTRRKRGPNDWAVSIYRPFPTEASFKAALEKKGVAYEYGSAFPVSIDSRLSPTNHVRNAFVDIALFEQLPSLAGDIVSELLDETPFVQIRGDSGAWRTDGNSSVLSPTAASFSIVPIGYRGAFLPVTTESCMRCHRDAGQVVNLQGEQRWRLRGGDGIFSWHIFDPRSFEDGVLRTNDALARAGLIVER